MIPTDLDAKGLTAARQRIDDALVSCAGLIRSLTSDDVGRVAAAELDYVRTALSSVLPPPCDGVKVRELEWTSEPPYSVARIPLLSMHYATECVWDDGAFLYCILSGTYVNRQFSTLAEAKAFAQSDFDRRIRSALTAVPRSFTARQRRSIAGQWPRRG